MWTSISCLSQLANICAQILAVKLLVCVMANVIGRVIDILPNCPTVTFRLLVIEHHLWSYQNPHSTDAVVRNTTRSSDVHTVPIYRNVGAVLIGRHVLRADRIASARLTNGTQQTHSLTQSTSLSRAVVCPRGWSSTAASPLFMSYCYKSPIWELIML